MRYAHWPSPRWPVLRIGRDTGVHPFSTFTTFTYDGTKRVPITIDTLFTPGSQPLAELNQIVAPEFEKRGNSTPLGRRMWSLTLDDGRLVAHGIAGYHISVHAGPHRLNVGLPALAR